MSATAPCSTMRPAVHHRDPVARLGDDAQVVGDEQQRGVEVVLQVGDDREDLGLDQHVESRRRSSAITKRGFNTSARG